MGRKSNCNENPNRLQVKCQQFLKQFSNFSEFFEQVNQEPIDVKFIELQFRPGNN